MIFPSSIGSTGDNAGYVGIFGTIVTGCWGAYPPSAFVGVV